MQLTPQKRAVGAATVDERLLDGRYRVTWQGRQIIARSQTGQLALGATVTVADTESGPVIVSAGKTTASSITEVIIHG